LVESLDVIEKDRIFIHTKREMLPSLEGTASILPAYVTIVDARNLGSKTVFFYELILNVYFGTYASKITKQK
jgi:hypothetical protein